MGEFRGNQHTDGEFVGYTYPELVSDVIDLAEKLDGVPTTDDAMKSDDLPSLSLIYSIAEDGWLGVLEDAGLEKTQVREYGASAVERMRDDIASVAAQTPGNSVTSREYSNFGEYPTSVVKQHFGSWRDACEAANVKSGRKHGNQIEGPYGAMLESKLEAKVAQWLAEKDIEYEVHPSIPRSNWIGDFYLPTHELWIEVDGYTGAERPNSESFQEKIEELRNRGEECLHLRGVSELREELFG